MRRALSLALVSGSISGAQAPVVQPAAPTPQIHTETTVVLVPALVRSADGKVVFTLKADDFTLTDDGLAQQLTMDEDTGGEPLALVVVVETGGAGAQKLGSYDGLNAAITAVVGAVPHKVAVVAFDSTPKLVREFTSDLDAVAATLSDLDAGDKGASILDAISFSVDRLRAQPQSYRRAILLITETMDRTSQTKMDDALRAISDTNTAIYSVAFSSGKADAAHYAYRELPATKTENGFVIGSNAYPGPPHGCMGKDPDPDATQNKAAQAFDCLGLLAPPLALAKMAAIRAREALERNVPETVAALTGGEYFRFDDARSLQRDLFTISNHVPNRYVLSFHPASPHAGFHAIDLKLKQYPGLRLEARSGYWVDEQSKP